MEGARCAVVLRRLVRPGATATVLAATARAHLQVMLLSDGSVTRHLQLLTDVQIRVVRLPFCTCGPCVCVPLNRLSASNEHTKEMLPSPAAFLHFLRSYRLCPVLVPTVTAWHIQSHTAQIVSSALGDLGRVLCKRECMDLEDGDGAWRCM